MLSHAKNNGYAQLHGRSKGNTMIVRETRIKAAGIKQEEDQRCPKTNGFLELNSFFFGARLSFTRRIRTRSRNMEKKKRKMRAEEKALLTWPSHASPSHLHYSIQHPCLFLEFPSFTGIHVSCSTAFSRDFVPFEELKMVHQELAISFRTKILILLRKEAFVSTFNITKYRYYRVLCTRFCMHLFD